MKKRMIAIVLVLALSLSLAPQVFAETLSDYNGQVNVMIRSTTPHEYLTVQRGGYTVNLSARTWSYVTADNKATGPAFCAQHGYNYPRGYHAVDLTDPYTNQAATGAFSSGYPIVSLSDFTAAHPEVSGLTEDEYGYASQVAVRAALGQIAVEGTAYTSGAETVTAPTDPAKLRIFNAIKFILESAGAGASQVSGLHFRAETNVLGTTVDLGNQTSLESAANAGQNGIKSELINGKEYYTREFTVSCASEPDGGKIGMTVSGAPSGTILASTGNTALESSGGTWYAPVSAGTGVGGAAEYAYRFKVCIPANAAEVSSSGNVTIKATATASACTFYYIKNSNAYEQDFIIADPESSSASAAAYLKWGEGGEITEETGNISITKTDENGTALEGVVFSLDGSGGYHASGTTDANGTITWYDLPTSQTYTITETAAVEGYQLADPVSVTVTAGQTKYLTITDETEKVFRIHKQDAQNKAALAGAVFTLTQIDGSFTTEGTTYADGILEFRPSELPYGSYRVSEKSAPDGFERDTTVMTVHWTGKADIDLVFTNTRKSGFEILKVDEATGSPLTNAVFNIYQDGELIDTVQTNEAGIATVSGVSEGYFECEEIVAPAGYVLNSTRVGIHIDPYDPATAADPVIRITNRARPALRIVKYDGQTRQPLPNTTFAVYRDATLIGEYTTGATGEIFLYDLAPGTYRVEEQSTVSSHVVNSTPQEIELEAGVTETYTLVFLNYLKPGIHLVKLDSQTFAPLANAKYRVTQIGGTFSNEYTSDASGEVELTGLDPGSYTVEELSPPSDSYLIDDPQRIIKIEAGENAEFVFTDTRKPSLRLVKLDSLTGERLPGATYRIAKIEDGTHYLDRITDMNGEINLYDLEPGVYSAQEMSAPEGYVLNSTEYHVELFAGQLSQLVVSDDQKPDLRIVKRDADTGEFLAGATFTVKKADGATLTSELTANNGEIFLESLDPGVYEVIEKSPPTSYLPARNASQLITLTANKLGTVIFENYAEPTLTVKKISSVTGELLQGAKFSVVYRSNNTETGEINDLGTYYTDENGQFQLTGLRDGWYQISELEPPTGYALREPSTQNVYIKGGEDKIVTFADTPLSALVVYKYDSVDGTAVMGAIFQVKYLTDTSGTGGTVIGTYKTGANGSFTVTGLREGTYIVEELASDSGHVIDTAPQTAYISGKEQDVVELYFGNAPRGAVLIKKIDSITRAPLSDVQFFVTDSSGVVLGNANGYYTTDSAGTILIDGLAPGTTIVAKETRSLENYLLDDTPQTIRVKSGETVSIEFRNQPLGNLLIVKRDSVTGKPLQGVTYTIKTSSGTYVDNNGGRTSSNGEYVTDASGQISLTGLLPDTYIVTEKASISGYSLDATPHSIVVRAGDTQTLNLVNHPKGEL